MLHFALAGNPNCGKTTLFNSLTGSTAYVGNWPGVTVDKREGTYKKLSEPVSIVDLPGIYSLSPYSPEEVVSRNFILDEHPDAIINIIDATNLERNLYLTTQLLEMNVPMILALNMMDLLKKNQEVIDVKALENKLGIPVVEISALKEENLDTLMQKAYEMAKNKTRKTFTLLQGNKLEPLVDKLAKIYQENGVTNSLFHTIKLIENDEIEVKSVEKDKELLKIVNDFKANYKDETFGNDFEAIVADDRYKYISNNLASCKSKIKGAKEDVKKQDENLTVSDKVDRVLTNKYAGIPIFAFILFIIFHLTFSANFLFLQPAVSNLEPTLAGTTWEGLVVSGDGIASPGVFLQTLLVGTTDWFTDVVRGWMANQAEWATGLLCDGILAGLFSVLSFLPQILLLFLFFSILEDSGYMARVAFILDRIFRKFGLSGRAFMPMIMGFGCSVPAMINTRTLADANERTATIRVIPFFSCGAKLPILASVGANIASMAGLSNPDIITWSIYLFGMVVAIVAVLVMRHTTMRGEVPPFIMELPSYHLPQLRALWIHVWDKIKHFIKKAFTIILVSNILIWVLAHVSVLWNQFLPDDLIAGSLTVNADGTVTQTLGSIIYYIGTILQPIFTPLGFGSQNVYMWVFVVSAIMGLIAKENVISSMTVLALVVSKVVVPEDDGNAAVEAMIQATNIGIPGLLAYISFNLLTIPCFAATGTAKAELPKGKFVGTVVFWLVTSYSVSSMFYMIGTWWWTLFIYIALIALIVVLVHFYYKNKDKTLKASN